MKMKQVCQETGLTEKAVRLYMQEGLVQPAKTDGLHSVSYDFSEADVQQLKTIAALRSAQVSIADIQKLLEHPEMLPAFLDAHRQALNADIQQKQAIAEAIDRLSPADTGNLKAAAAAIQPPKMKEPEKDIRGTALTIGLACCCALVLCLSFWGESPAMLKLAIGTGSFLIGVLSIVMSFVYAAAPLRAKRLPSQTVGTVIAVIKQTGYDAAFSIQSTAVTGAPSWGGRGGLWALFFMLWNEVRPDHWVPIIQFVDAAGVTQSGTFPYGGLKMHFQSGQQVRIAWGKYPSRLQPLSAPWLYAKACAYLLLGTAMVIVGGILFAAAFSAMELA